jgi:starch-binding outer membrane protein, SusD/RagB family
LIQNSEKMKKNIKTRITLLTTSFLMMFAISCDDFLEIPPTGQIGEAQLQTLEGLDAALLAVYSQVNGRHQRMASPSNWVWGSIRGGDANKGTDPGDFQSINPIQRYENDATIDILRENWAGLYEGVSRANSVLRLLENKNEDVPEGAATHIEAQAKFLRAHFYFQLTRNFNRVPYVDETVDYQQGLEEVVNNQDMWPFIEADFQFAVNNLPDTQSEVGRVNAWAAKSYLAKVYLYQKKFQEAKTLFDDVIANGVTSNGLRYDLVPYYEDMFRGANNNHEESIWAYQSAANTGSVNNANPEFDLNFPYNTGPEGPGNCCGFFQPAFSFVNSFRTQNGLPLLNGAYNDPSNAVKHDFGVDSDQPFTTDDGPLDPRVDHTTGRRGIPYLDWRDHPGNAWIRNRANGGPYSPKKYVYTREEQGVYQDNSSWTPGYTAINIMIIRFADVLLMAAEAEIELGNLEQARQYTNRVRQRAINSPLLRPDGTPAANYQIGLYETPWADPDQARTAVRFERKLELGMEGHRFYDLVRWETDVDELNRYLNHESQFLGAALGGTSYTTPYRILPIPQDQIDLVGSDILIQNPGF